MQNQRNCLHKYLHLPYSLSLSFLLLFRFRVNIVIFGLRNENAGRFLKGWNESTLKIAINHFADVELTIQVCCVVR